MKEADELVKELAALDRDPEFELNIRDILEAIVSEFGGPAGLAKHLAHDYQSAKAGSQTRVNLMGGVLRLLDKYEGTSEDDMSEEDLASIAAMEKATANADASVEP